MFAIDDGSPLSVDFDCVHVYMCSSALKYIVIKSSMQYVLLIMYMPCLPLFASNRNAWSVLKITAWSASQRCTRREASPSIMSDCSPKAWYERGVG